MAYAAASGAVMALVKSAETKPKAKNIFAAGPPSKGSIYLAISAGDFISPLP